MQHNVYIDGLAVGPDQPVRVMGVINLSPESFYQESVVTEEDRLRDVVREMEQAGASVIDVGAASSAPSRVYGTVHVSVDEELERVKTYLPTIVEAASVPVSIDTVHFTVAEVALDIGASLVNDISGLNRERKMAGLVAARGVPVVLMADCDGPCMSIDEAIRALKGSIRTALGAGIARESLITDPGIGFGKPCEADLALIRGLHRFTLLGHPVLVGISRKAFLGELLGAPRPEDRLTGTIAATAIAVARGADMVRAHDVQEAAIASRVGRALRDALPCSRGHEVELIGSCSQEDAAIVLEHIGVDAEAIGRLAKKATGLNILLRGLSAPAALVLKQEMLALGGDAAYHRDVIDFQTKTTDVLLMGNVQQVERLCRVLRRASYFGLQEVGESVSSVLSCWREYHSKKE